MFPKSTLIGFCCLFLATVTIVSCRTLPSYIKACKVSDADFNACMKKNAQAALPDLFKGDPNLKIPSLLPYRIQEANITAGPNLQISLKDCDIHGLDTLKILETQGFLENQTLKVQGILSKVSVLGDYVIDGRILLLPITGSGKINITLVDLKVDYGLNFEKEKRDDGVEYFKINNATLGFEPETTHYSLENLFGGDKTLGEEMNKFLNENYKEVGKEVNAGYETIIKLIIDSVVNAVLKDVPFDDVIIPS